MKLLIVTQAVDKRHPILGFFHGWIEAFSRQVESVEVICLEKGEYDLPPNVTVHSLGKEEKTQSTIVYTIRYVKLLWSLRKKYDTVFAHMNPEYIIAGFPVWFVTAKRIGMWYAHGAVSLRLRLAALIAHKVFTSTSHGFRLATKKCNIVGQGIDTTLFSRGTERKTEGVTQLVTIGRIAPSKNLDKLLRCCALLKQNDVPFVFSIVGAVITEEEKKYKVQLQQLIEELSLKEEIVFVGSVKQTQLPAVLQKADIFIHDGRTGSLDKALLEAMSAGLPVLSSNDAYTGIVDTEGFDPTYSAGAYEALASLVQKFIALPEEQKEAIILRNRKLIIEDHSIETFIEKIVSKYTIN